MIEIRSCVGFDELQACVDLQAATWGYDAIEVEPRKVFHVNQQAGGQVIGAFDAELSDASDAGRLVGFAMAVPGIKSRPGEAPTPYLHSHMLAVRPSYRNHGLGARLKRFQRDEALSRGLRHMEWTFDPLEIKNAYLNIHKLGAVIRHYRADFYGVSSSRLQAGLPTDRLLAEWTMDAARVRQALAGTAGPACAIEERILVPAAIYTWKDSDESRPRALAVQQENRRKFQQAFARGLAVVGFSLDADKNGIYELGRLAAGSLDPQDC
jgi:predicted GNAT superfamily acetyltransferase